MASGKKKTVAIRQVRSAIRRPKDQQETLLGLGLTRMMRLREIEDTPSTRGMMRKVSHLIEILGE